MKYSGSVNAGSLLAPLGPPASWQGSGPPGQAPARGRFARALACLLALAGPLAQCPSPAMAQDAGQGAAESKQGASQLAPGHELQVGGVRGVWWPLATAQVLTQEHVTLPAVNKLSAQQAQKITLLEERLQLRMEIEGKLQLQVDALTEVVDGCADREAAKSLEVLKTQEQLSRARWIWSMVGAGVVVVLVGGAWALTAGL